MEINKQMSDGLNITKLIVTILIIAIHYNSKMYLTSDDITTWNYTIQEFITNGIARIAVPFFALSSGLLFFINFKNITDYKHKITRRLKTLIVPYLLAGAIALICDVIIKCCILNNKDSYTLYDIVYKSVLNPIAVQLWFLRDLILISFCSPLIYLILRYLSPIYLCCLCVIWFLGYQIFPMIFGLPLIQTETLLFFSIGGWIALKFRLFHSLFKIKLKWIALIAILFLILISVRVSICPVLIGTFTKGGNAGALFLQKISIVLGVYVMLAVSASSNITNKKLNCMARFSFFAYLYHTYPLYVLVINICSFFVGDKYLFYPSFPLATAIIFLIPRVLNNLCPNFYCLLAGGRGSRTVQICAK